MYSDPPNVAFLNIYEYWYWKNGYNRNLDYRMLKWGKLFDIFNQNSYVSLNYY